MFSNSKKILLLAIPSIISFATATLTGTINLIMLGHMGALIIAIIGVSNIIMYNAFAIFSGLGHTVNYLVAQNFGSDTMKKGIERTYVALIISCIFGVLILVFGFLFSDIVLQWTGGSQALIDTGSYYLKIRFMAMAVGIINFTFHGFLRGVGDTRTSMTISIVVNVLIIALTYGLTFGHMGLPELGLPGSAWAMLIGEGVGLLLCLYVFLVPMHKRFHTRTRISIVRNETVLILKESGKLGVQEFSMSISMFIFTMFVARLGDVALAANEVALNVMSLGFMPAFAFGSTATILVGQEIGDGNYKAARRAGTDTAIMGSVFLLLLGTVEFFLAEPIARIYAPGSPEVFVLAGELIMISAFMQLFDGLLNFYAGGLRGIGDTTFLLRASFILSIFLFLPLSYFLIFTLDMGSIGAWCALYAYLMLYGVAVMVRYYRTDWSQVRIKEAAAH